MQGVDARYGLERMPARHPMKSEGYCTSLKNAQESAVALDERPQLLFEMRDNLSCTTLVKNRSHAPRERSRCRKRDTMYSGLQMIH
jgi:hypothetical protein